MRRDLVDITLVVDRSGSMYSICDDAQGGVNDFVKRQAAEEGQALISLTQFDTEYEVVYQGVPADQAPPYQLIPRGGTALLDAVGRGITETGARLAAMAEAERPGLVVFVIVTDGHENSSREFTKQQIKTMIEHQQSVYNWQFTFLGANQDAFAEAGGLGIGPAAACTFAPEKVQFAYEATAFCVARMRKQHRTGETVRNEFTEQERQQMS